MTQLGQQIANLSNYANLNNAPTNVTSFQNNAPYTLVGSDLNQFTNNANYAKRGENVSEFANDVNYAQRTDGVSEFTNDANYAKKTDNVSQFNNDAGYTTSNDSNPTLAYLQGGNVEGQIQSVAATNIGLTQFSAGLASTGGQLQIQHLLPVANANQTYIGFAQAFCPASGVDVGIICTIYYCNNYFFRVTCQQQNGAANGETHGANDILISWQMSLVNFPYTNVGTTGSYNNGLASGSASQTVTQSVTKAN